MTTTAYEIPLQATPQTLTISLAGVTYQLRVLWNFIAAAWVVDLMDDLGNPILSGLLPLITGADLLEQFGYLNLGGQLIVQTDNDTDAVPTFDNLGANGHLYFVVVTP